MAGHGPHKLDPPSFYQGRYDEFMRHTRGDIAEIKGDVKTLSRNQTELARAMAEHSLQAGSTAEDVGEIKAAMKELHSCFRHLADKVQHHETQEEVTKSSSKGKWKHIGLGAVICLGLISFAVAVMAGGDEDLLVTLSRVIGVLL